MNDFLAIIILVFGILQIILFFKIWGMTNDVDKIYQLLNKKIGDDKTPAQPYTEKQPYETNRDLDPAYSVKEPEKQVEVKKEFEIGDIVNYQGNPVQIVEINKDGTFSCYNMNGEIVSNSIKRSEIKIWEE